MIARELKVGDTIWWAVNRLEHVKVQCPVCFGKLSVTLILGDDSEVITPCDYCGKGYEGPKGVVGEHRWHTAPELITIEQVNAQERDGSRKVEYLAKGNYCIYVADIFETEAEASVACESKREAQQRQELEQASHRRKSNHLSYSWAAGYHMREAKEHRRKLEYHEKHAIICKEKSRTTRSKPQ